MLYDFFIVIWNLFHLQNNINGMCFVISFFYIGDFVDHFIKTWRKNGLILRNFQTAQELSHSWKISHIWSVYCIKFVCAKITVFFITKNDSTVNILWFPNFQQYDMVICFMIFMTLKLTKRHDLAWVRSTIGILDIVSCTRRIDWLNYKSISED